MTDTVASDPRPIYRFPPSAYYSPDWFEQEMTKVFPKTWAMVGHVGDAPEPGDFFTCNVGREPVVVVRSMNGTLRAFLNICRHRGMVIKPEASGNCGGSLRCPYHGWDWSLEGELERVPQRKTQFADIDLATLGLHSVALEVWRGFIFVHTSPETATPFMEWIGDMGEHCGDYPWDDMVEISRRTHPVACNWKLFVENHIDWLHLWYLHAGSIDGYDHTLGVYGASGLNWWSLETLRDTEPDYVPDGVVAAPVSRLDSRSVRANMFFPNIPFAMTGHTMVVFYIQPTGPETTDIDFRIYAMPGSSFSDETWAFFEQIVITEDARACEKMQMAMHSSRFKVGPIAIDHERPIEDFQQNLLSFLDA